mmetsp:Transcript_3861/g.5492  ORF Transcript_3861/g.5492 Transcript_3861/m.5492 type:complete len:324 (-) Transcript_3861:43-1014(-)
MLQEWRGRNILEFSLVLLLLNLLVLQDGQDAGSKAVLKLLCSILLPILAVLVLDDPHWSSSVDQRPMGVVNAGLADLLLVLLGGATLDTGDESSADPDTVSAQAQGHGQSSAIENATSSHDRHLLASQRRQFSLAEVHHHWDEDASTHLASVATTLATLRADDVHTRIQGLLHMVRGADHVHHRDAGLVQLLHSPSWGHTDCTDEESSALLDGDVDELRQIAMGVVVVGLAGTAANLRDQQVHAKGSLRVLQVLLDFLNLRPEDFRLVSHATEDAEATSISDSSCQLGAGGDVHASQHHWVLDVEHLGDGSLDVGDTRHGCKR